MADSDEVVVTAPQKLATIRAAAAAAGRDLGYWLRARSAIPWIWNPHLDASPGCERQASPGSRQFAGDRIRWVVGVAAQVEALARIRERLRHETGANTVASARMETRSSGPQ